MHAVVSVEAHRLSRATTQTFENQLFKDVSGRSIHGRLCGSSFAPRQVSGTKRFGNHLSPLIFCCLEVSLFDSWLFWGGLRPLLGDLGSVLAGLERSWAALGRFWAALGRSWVALGSSWGALGSSWAALGSSWAALGSPWAALGRSWAALGAV